MPQKPGSTSPQWTEPLLLIDGDGPDDRVTEEAERRDRRWWRRLRAYLDVGLLVVLAATAVVVTRDREAPQAASATTDATADEEPARDRFPLLIAPARARPGEAVSLVAHRRQDLCGAIEVHLDGVRLDHRVTARIEAAQPGWDALLLTVNIPAASVQQDHELALFGPLPGTGRGGPRCGDREQRHARLATASIVVGAPPARDRAARGR